MRKLGLFLFFSMLFFCHPALGQEVDSMSTPAAQPADNRVPGYWSPQEFRDLVRRQAFNRRQRQREQAFEYSMQQPMLWHDIRLTAGFGPLFESWGDDEWGWQYSSNPASDVLRSKYSESLFGRHCFAAVSLAYAYRISRRCEIGMSVSYTGYRNSLTGVPDGVPGTTLREHYLSIMPVFRLLWLDCSWGRFYSGFEMGPQMAMRRGFFERNYDSEMRFSGQFTYAGITVGRKCFFNAELGVGCRGFVNLGIGWRIDTKTGKR